MTEIILLLAVKDNGSKIGARYKMYLINVKNF
jgi:hypothetical protein